MVDETTTTTTETETGTGTGTGTTETGATETRTDTTASIADALYPDQVKPDERKDDDQKDDDQKDDDQKDDGTATDPDAVPEGGAYTPTVPEGVQLDAAGMEMLSPLLARANATNGEAQQLVDFITARDAKMAETQAEAFDTTVKEWENATRTDKQLGGDQFDANIALASKALSAYGSDELRTTLDKSGLGSHPEVIRLLVNVGKGITDDDVPLPNGGQGQPGAQTPNEVAAELYGATTPTTRAG